ncbi:MAG: hypothetical protein R3F07_04725 [Opitutaceae bacterium]
MKFAFMSFSCPTADLGQMIGLAREYGYDGMNNPDALEFRPFGAGEYDLATVFRSLITDGCSGYLSGEWINWEPAEVHLPREIQAMRAFEASFTPTAS